MEEKNLRLCSAAFLILGFIGLLYFWINSLKTPSIQTTLQFSTILYMVLLSMAIFFVNNETKLANTFGIIPLKYYEIVSLFWVFGGIIVIELISLTANNGLFLPPLFLASITLGIFFASKWFNRP